MPVKTISHFRLASNMAGYLYREGPDDEKDSGWRITAGNESDEYMDDSENIAYGSLGLVLNPDDSILPLLECPVGTTFERTSEGREFVQVRNND